MELEENNISYKYFSPDIDQYHVINYLNNKKTGETRNISQEAARIVRGNCKPLTELQPTDYNELLVPGGFDVAKNLLDIAFKGKEFAINNQFL